MAIKEFKYMCDCGAVYKFQGTSEEMEDFLDADFWLCEVGGHVETGQRRNYLTLVEMSAKISEMMDELYSER